MIGIVEMANSYPSRLLHVSLFARTNKFVHATHDGLVLSYKTAGPVSCQRADTHRQASAPTLYRRPQKVVALSGHFLAYPGNLL